MQQKSKARQGNLYLVDNEKSKLEDSINTIF